MQMSKTEADKLIDERIKVYNNLSAAQLKVNVPDDALHSIEVVLKLQPHNVKALFRKGMVGTLRKCKIITFCQYMHVVFSKIIGPI